MLVVSTKSDTSTICLTRGPMTFLGMLKSLDSTKKQWFRRYCSAVTRQQTFMLPPRSQLSFLSSTEIDFSFAKINLLPPYLKSCAIQNLHKIVLWLSVRVKLVPPHPITIPAHMLCKGSSIISLCEASKPPFILSSRIRYDDDLKVIS